LWVQATTSAVTPCLVINGPIRHKLHVNSGRGALGPGWRANATIGRALRLIMINIGGGRPGEIDKATLGQPGKYTFCLGELEEESPWDPLHVERGLRPQDSAVTVFGIQGTSSVRTAYLKPESILMVVADAMAVYGNNSYHYGVGNPVVVLTPGYARIFHDAGWSKTNIKEWLFEATKISPSVLPPREDQPRHREPTIMAGDDRICICAKPDDIMVIVAGSAEAYHVTYLHSAGAADIVTEPIREQSR
jgi:hypothetical protein